MGFRSGELGAPSLNADDADANWFIVHDHSTSFGYVK
jgi:hypothetical protein